MSLLSEAYAVPSVVKGVYRYLLHARGQKSPVETLVAILAPEALETFTRNLSVANREHAPDAEQDDKKAVGKDRVRKTVNECLRLGLFAQEGEDIVLHPDLPKETRDMGTGEDCLPLTIARLVLNADNEANHDLCSAIAWYLTLDAYAPPGSWAEVERILIDTGMKETVKLGDVRYHMLEDWLSYLGFGWAHTPGEPRLVPDPTVHLRWRLPELFPGPDREAMPVVMSRLTALCPVLEGGVFRTRLGGAAAEPANRLSTATALAWLRLRDEGKVELHHESDTATLVLPDGDQTVLVSHITLARVTAKGRRHAV
jgi:hypothetical protein